MSIVAPSQRRLVWPVAIALTATTAIALLLYLPTRTATLGSSDGTGSIAAPGIAQAHWEVKTFPAGGAGVRALSKASRAQIATQKAPIGTLITDLYDSLFLEPDRLTAVLRASFSAPAAKQVVAARLGMPASATEVRIERRTARIGIHMQGASRAAARVVIAGRALVKGRHARFHHEATLWLERARKSWKVIGFDVTQGPTR